MGTIQYRADIDGLRAIAVLAVVLFHLSPSFLSGGFVGVDIFFVISGYLITSILQRDIVDRKFSLLKFWERRIRRILPALFAVVFTCLLAGWVLFLPNDYERLARQSLSVAIFASNILFYMQSGYFDAGNDTKPLLHTWSLSVEEQFYLFFPLALFLIAKFIPSHLKAIFIAVFILSLSSSIYGSYTYPTATFYLLPTRMWELLLGALIAFFPARGFLSKKCAEVGATAGGCLILFSVWAYSKETPFPGWAAIVPCLGAALLIWFGGAHNPVVSRILSLKPFVFVGKISYSWYLWHWPAVVFYKYYYPQAYGFPDIAILLLSTFFISVFSWRYIETPFRYYQASRLRIFSIFAVTTFATITMSLLLHFQEGYPARFSPSVLVYAHAENDKNPYQELCNRPSLDRVRQDKICTTSTDTDTAPSFILWGDSHADAIAPVFYALSKQHDIQGYVVTYDGCPPILDMEQEGRDSDFYCKLFNDEVLRFIQRNRIKNVFLVSAWGNWMFNPRLYPSTGHDDYLYAPLPQEINKDVLSGLDRTLKLLAREGLHVFVMQTIPTAEFSPPQELALDEAFPGRGGTHAFIPLDSYGNACEPIEILSRSYHESPSITFLDPGRYLCNDDGCSLSRNGRSLYYNGGHLSVYGAEQLGDLFRVPLNIKNASP